MEIIDSQIHEPLPWLAEDDRTLSDVDRNIMATELALSSMDALGVSAAFIHSPRPGWAEFAVANFPDRFAYKVWVDHTREDLEDEVSRLRDRPGVLGIRVSGFGPNAERTQPLRDGAYERLFAAAEHSNVPVSIYLPGSLPLAGEIARAHPNLTLIIEHVGIQQPMPLNGGKADTPRFAKLPELIALAPLSNVAVKLSGLCTLSMEMFPFKDLREPFGRIVEAFGPSRLMWGSDIQRVQGRSFPHPYDRIEYVGKHTYAEALFYVRDSDQLSRSDKELILAGTFRRLYRWEPSSRKDDDNAKTDPHHSGRPH